MRITRRGGERHEPRAASKANHHYPVPVNASWLRFTGKIGSPLSIWRDGCSPRILASHLHRLATVNRYLPQRPVVNRRIDHPLAVGGTSREFFASAIGQLQRIAAIAVHPPDIHS